MEASRLAQVGPRYGVKDYLNAVEASWRKESAATLWSVPAEHGLRMRLRGPKLVDHILEGMRTGPFAKSIMGIDAPAPGRRLGKSSTLASVIVGHPALLGEPGDDDEVAVKHGALMLMGMNLRIEDDRVVGTLNAPLVAMTSHALERVYERERVHTGGMDVEMHEMSIAMTRAIAAAAESGVVIKGETETEEDEGNVDADPATGRPADAVHPLVSDVTLVPCKGGLMVVESVTMVSVSDTKPIARLETRRSGTWSKGDPSLGDRVSEISHRGHRVFVSTVRLCRTYLSRDLLRPEQVRYRDLFLDGMGRVDGAAAARRLFGSDERHQAVSVDRVELPGSDEMRVLLPRCVRPPRRPDGIWLIY